jgi:hypothetical protein
MRAYPALGEASSVDHMAKGSLFAWLFAVLALLGVAPGDVPVSGVVSGS